MSKNVRLQKLRDFTVQIRHPTTDDIVGTGIVVSADGKVVTCAHVVKAVLGVHPRKANGAEVGVYFPQARGSDAKARFAKVTACFPQHDDDMVLLQLDDGPSHLASEQIAVLGTADESITHPFRSYGYCPLGTFPSARASGIIMGDVEPPEGRIVHADPVQLKSGDIAPGMSGSAVLDVERNLVVGIISATWFPDRSGKHRDAAWAVNARVLAFDPFNLPLRDISLEKSTAPQPITYLEAARAAIAPELGIAWNNAPALLPEWVGREGLLKAISADWADPNCRVTGLIGFGGEGKSSLTRRWLDNLLADSSQSQPDGVFWWSFYNRPNVDAFFEAALDFLSGGKIDPRDHPSTNAKAHFIAGMLYAGCYLFVLDGLEVMQHQAGDQYGLLLSNDLRAFLEYFAAPGHESLCLITSRAPVLDLEQYTTYTHRNVTRLSPTDGRVLLRAVGVTGEDRALDHIVADWDGHALTLSLLGTYLARRYGGDVAYIDEIPPPTANEPRYKRVHRVLRRYDEHLTEAERAFLMIFSAFRTPVKEAAFEKVFRAGMGTDTLNAPITVLDDADFEAMVQRLVAYRILRYASRIRCYTTHPLIRAHYLVRLTAGDHAQAQCTHERIKGYYLELVGYMLYHPMLNDLAPLIEAMHHACHAGAFDEAYRIRRERIDQFNRQVLTWELGAYETRIGLMSEFFPNGDTSQEPWGSASERSHTLNEVGFCLMSLGRLGDAVPIYERVKAIDLTLRDWHNASITYRNLTDLHVHLGVLAAGAGAAREALALARRVKNKEDECYSLVRQAWIAYLRGNLVAADAAFQQAEVLQREDTPQVYYLYSNRGILHADYLRRTGDRTLAWCVTDANLEISERNRWVKSISPCHRILGDLNADAGQFEGARWHYDEALGIARSITRRDVIIEALLARGRWAARHRHDALAALNDLIEALDYATASGYRIYETDIRVALAWAHLAAGDPSAALAEAEHAQRMSAEMGYHWGQVDAAEVLAALDQD